MAHYSSDRKPPSMESHAVGGSPVGDSRRKEVRAAHRIQRVKIRGLLMDIPGAGGPFEVCVNHQAHWELIYKNPDVRVKCLVQSCDTLLTAKRMSRSGLRFLAARSGGCSHNLVEMRVEQSEIEQDPSELAGGGGPEGLEHLWFKGRLYSIAKVLGAEAVIEHSFTRADVFLPEHNLVLEYQRWNTDFRGRTAQRTSAGADRTIWMFPWQPPGAPPSHAHKAFDQEVFQNGGIYVAVLNKDDRREAQRPWEDASQERTARLYASGSIAVFDPRRRALVRTRLSLATVLAQIISGDRVLDQAAILNKRTGRVAKAWVWALSDDFACARAAHEERRRPVPPIIDKDPQQPSEPPAPPEIQLEGRSTTEEEHSVSLSDDMPASAESAELALDPPATTQADHRSTPTPGVVPSVNSTASTVQSSKIQQPAPRRSWWSTFADWLRQV